MTSRSDKSDGSTAGTETVDPLEFLARVLMPIPDKGHVTTRYDGWYANRPRGIRGKAATAAAAVPPAIVSAPTPTERAATLGRAGVCRRRVAPASHCNDRHLSVGDCRVQAQRRAARLGDGDSFSNPA